MEKTSPQDNKVWIYFFVMKHSSKTGLGPQKSSQCEVYKDMELENYLYTCRYECME